MSSQWDIPWSMQLSHKTI